MLKQMREGAKSTFLKMVLFGLLLLAMAGLALMDVQGMFRGGLANSTIASYSKGKITAPEFDRLVQTTLRSQQMKQSDAYRAGLPKQILKQEIDNRLFSLAAEDIGLQMSDKMAAKQVKEMLAPLVQKGMTEREALERLLQAYGLSENQLVTALKSQSASQQLLDTISIGAYAPPQLLSDALRYRREWRRGEYFFLSADDIGGVKNPSDAELKSYYDSIASEYALPEYRTLSVIVLDKKSLGDAAKLSEDKLREYYDDNIADYKTPETRVISQVVATDEEAAKLVYAAAEKNKNLQKAAEAAGKGKASYIKSGTFTEKEVPVELAKAAFGGEAGKVLAPLKTPLGWHILYVEKVTPAITKSFDSVKADIERDLSQDKISEALYERANKIDDEIGGGKTLAEVARENNVAETVLEKIDARGIGQNGQKPEVNLPLFEKLVENGFSLKKGAASPLIETPDGAFMIVAAKEIFPSEQQPFDKVRSAVLARWKTDHQLKSLSDKAAKLMERLKKGETFSKIAGEFGKSVQSTELVQRGTPALKARMQENMMSALFSLDRVNTVTTVSNDNGLILIRLVERKVQSPKDVSKQDRETTEAILNRSLRQDLLEQYRLHLMAKYDVHINEKLLSDAYAPKEGNEMAEEEE